MAEEAKDVVAAAVRLTPPATVIGRIRIGSITATHGRMPPRSIRAMARIGLRTKIGRKVRTGPTRIGMMPIGIKASGKSGRPVHGPTIRRIGLRQILAAVPPRSDRAYLRRVKIRSACW